MTLIYPSPLLLRVQQEHAGPLACWWRRRLEAVTGRWPSCNEAGALIRLEGLDPVAAEEGKRALLAHILSIPLSCLALAAGLLDLPPGLPPAVERAIYSVRQEIEDRQRWRAAHRPLSAWAAARLPVIPEWGQVRILLHGVPVVGSYNSLRRTLFWRVEGHAAHYRTRREAVWAWLAGQSPVRSLHGWYRLERAHGRGARPWVLVSLRTWRPREVAQWPTRPSRAAIAQAIRADRRVLLPLEAWASCAPVCHYGRGRYQLWRALGRGLRPWWLQDARTGRAVAIWRAQPTREQLAAAIRASRGRWLSSHYGWRAWRWDPQAGLLRSPDQGTPWPTPVLQAHTWSTNAALRGEAGIHARHAPADWRTRRWEWWGAGEGPDGADRWLVHGLVRRYGRAVVGPRGWRAEHVVILGLVAPSPEIELRLRERYPGVEVLTQE